MNTSHNSHLSTNIQLPNSPLTPYHLYKYHSTKLHSLDLSHFLQTSIYNKTDLMYLYLPLHNLTQKVTTIKS